MSLVLEEISQNARLISLPDIYLRLRNVLNEPDYDMQMVAEVISSDPAAVVRLLRIVNSAYFGLATPIDSVKRAVSLLGTLEVHDLVLSMSIAQSFDGLSNEIMTMQRFWHKSVVCAITSRELATRCNVLDSERLFVCGLLRDIGHLFIYQSAPYLAEQAIEMAQRHGAPLYKAERALLSTDYARVGAYLMRHWQLPESLSESTEHHIEPQKSSESAIYTSLVHIAATLTEANDLNEPLDGALSRVSSHAWQVTGLSAEACLEVFSGVSPQVEGVMQLMFPSENAA